MKTLKVKLKPNDTAWVLICFDEGVNFGNCSLHKVKVNEVNISLIQGTTYFVKDFYSSVDFNEEIEERFIFESETKALTAFGAICKKVQQGAKEV